MNHQRMHRTLKRFAHSRLALSTVVTTLIVFVVSVLLAGVVTYFAINVTSTRVQEESLVLAKQHIWFDAASSTTQAAIMVINTGGRDVVVDRLTVRGQECAWSKVYFTTVGDSVSGDLAYNTTLIDGGTISVGGSNRVFEQAANDLTIQSGKTLIIYIYNPDSISVNDIGLTVSINIFTSQAMYYKETNVQGTSGTQTVSSGSIASEINLPYAEAYYHVSPQFSQVGLVLSNVGEDDETISSSDLVIDGVQLTSDSMGYCIVDIATNDLPCLIPSTDEPVQTHTLNWATTSFTLPAGKMAIVYFTGISSITIDDAYTEVSVGVSLDDGQTVTKTGVTVITDSHTYP